MWSLGVVWLKICFYWRRTGNYETLPVTLSNILEEITNKLWNDNLLHKLISSIFHIWSWVFWTMVYICSIYTYSQIRKNMSFLRILGLIAQYFTEYFLTETWFLIAVTVLYVNSIWDLSFWILFSCSSAILNVFLPVSSANKTRPTLAFCQVFSKCLSCWSSKENGGCDV